MSCGTSVPKQPTPQGGKTNTACSLPPSGNAKKARSPAAALPLHVRKGRWLGFQPPYQTEQLKGSRIVGRVPRGL
ncbi:hypothetical protein KSP40_PGU004488 [Platanthera guangdongensis]|uniref:Uncharacterized protein n=1 Tax=Platanthera guangdongensis TaxID=2320717 RepID=A0ABR2N1X4_9ASPA